MSETNPYAAPCSAVATADEFGDVKIFSFAGRIGRLRYLAFNMIMVFALYFAIVIIAAITLPHAAGDMTVITLPIGLVSLASLPIGLMFIIQRLHDMNAGGWWSLLMFVPVVNALMGLVLLFAPGTGGSNRFGQQPKPNGAGVYLTGLALPVVVVGVLAAVAVPAYNDFVYRAQAAQLAN